MQHAIIEFKARCSDHDRIRELLRQKYARFVGTDHQIDTYFRVPEGRLKLREGTIENSLVFYSRPNTAGPKQSDVTMSLLPANTDTRAVLAKALGVLVTVDKQREIYFVDNVKIHLDHVAGLGQFLEVEAIGSPDQANQLRDQCNSFLREFGVRPGDFIAVSYSDLLLEQRSQN
ncbi:MAG TPA: class IV adenylate cyclase [Terriglobales bacterium]|nr:class IV adenylate cyclase [Terriglobales bacterium]